MLQVTSFPFSLVGPGQMAIGQVGFTSPADASYSASITTDPNSIFKVTEVLAVRPTLEFVDDGGGDSSDGVKVKHHRPTPVWVDEPVGATNGVTPLNVLKGDKLLVTVHMVCPNDPADMYFARLTVTSSDSADTTTVPLSVPTGQVDVQVLNSNAIAAPGANTAWLLGVQSVAGAGANISFAADPGGTAGLAGPPASVSIPTITAFLPRRGQQMLAITATVGDVTPPGSYGFFVAETIFNGADRFSPFSLSLTVTNPLVMVTSTQPSAFNIIPGTQIQFVLDVQLKGAATVLDLTINPTPSGLTCTFLDAQGNPIPKWHLNLTTKEQIQLPVRVSAAKGASPTPASLTFSWSAFDGTEQGSLSFGITMLPPQIDFDSGPIVFGGDVPVGGSAHVTIFSDGTSVFSGHLHDSGATAYNTAAICTVKDRQNRVYLFEHQGNVAGTFESGSRDDDWNTPGPQNASVVANWADLVGAAPTFQTSVTLDLGSLVTTTLSAIGTVAAVIGLVLSGSGRKSDH